jgi:DNA-binding Lrp family transcriptional regulator
MVNAIVLINCTRTNIEKVGQEIAAIEGVSEVFSVAGRVDLVVMIRVKTNEELAEVVAKRLAVVEGIEATETLIAFQVYSRELLEAGFAL